MSNIAKDILREYVNEQKFSNTQDVLEAMKHLFKDVLQETLEPEMDTYLGYNKYSTTDKQTKNSRNGYSKKL